MSVTRVLLSAAPDLPFADETIWKRGIWPASWIKFPTPIETPYVLAFCKRFTLESDLKFRAHVTADERYELFLDGERIGRGSERGDLNNWFFDSYDFDLAAGEHCLVARVWALGKQAPFAQISANPGFLFCPETPVEIELLATGVAQWQVQKLGGYEFVAPISTWGTGANLIINGAEYSWDFESGAGEWQFAEILQAAHAPEYRTDHPPFQVLVPATLPPQMDEKKHLGKIRHVADLPEIEEIETRDIPVLAADNLSDETGDWQELFAGRSTLIVPPHTRRRVLLDLENYFCAYPEIETSGGRGSTLRVHWQESLYHAIEPDVMRGKGNRDAIEGKFFAPVWPPDKDEVGDTFLPDGGNARRWSTLWWQCGRYVEVCVVTQDEPLTIESFAFRETRYPLEMESEFHASDQRLEDVMQPMVRAMQMCSHETYMDCPYYEQLQYIGDTRLEVLATYAMTNDDRLARKALKLFDVSRLSEGLTTSRYPSFVRQIIPPFSLWWVAMVHDFALWRDDLDFVKSLMPGVRAVMDAFREYRNADGLIEAPVGWNFCDWVPEWKDGIAPGADTGVSGVLNWQTVLVARMAAELEEWTDEPELACRNRKFAHSLADASTAKFWNEARGLFADDLEQNHFSEHTQCLALLSGLVETNQRERVATGLCEDENLARTTIYFSHYLFEAYREIGRMDLFFERMNLWFNLKEQGFYTTFEQADFHTTRSDCHAWGAHPLWHYFASVLGIRPTAPGFSKVLVSPQIGELESVGGVLPHPRGEIQIDLKHENGVLAATIKLPDCTTGEFDWCNQKLPLRSPCEQMNL